MNETNLSISTMNADKNMFTERRMKMQDHIIQAREQMDEAAMEAWHFIESDLRCCGDKDMTGYECKGVFELAELLQSKYKHPTVVDLKLALIRI